jgi:poly(A) polymerase
LSLQHRLENRRPRAVAGLMSHERFRAAYDFLVLRGEAGEDVTEAAEWWTRFQEVDGRDREAMLEELRDQPSAEKKPRRRRRRRRKPAE